VNKVYTVEQIKFEVDRDSERLFQSYSTNRPENWSTDTRTRQLICLGHWLHEELVKLNVDDLGRRVQELQYNRRSRSEEDLFLLVTTIMNETIDDKIDRNRVAHKRWG